MPQIMRKRLGGGGGRWPMECPVPPGAVLAVSGASKRPGRLDLVEKLGWGYQTSETTIHYYRVRSCRWPALVLLPYVFVGVLALVLLGGGATYRCIYRRHRRRHHH
jgi:hypothetical protein